MIIYLPLKKVSTHTHAATKLMEILRENTIIMRKGQKRQPSSNDQAKDNRKICHFRSIVSRAQMDNFLHWNSNSLLEEFCHCNTKLFCPDRGDKNTCLKNRFGGDWSPLWFSKRAFLGNTASCRAVQDAKFISIISYSLQLANLLATSAQNSNYRLALRIAGIGMFLMPSSLRMALRPGEFVAGF